KGQRDRFGGMFKANNTELDKVEDLERAFMRRNGINENIGKSSEYYNKVLPSDETIAYANQVDFEIRRFMNDPTLKPTVSELDLIKQGIERGRRYSYRRYEILKIADDVLHERV